MTHNVHKCNTHAVKRTMPLVVVRVLVHILALPEDNISYPPCASAPSLIKWR